MADNRIRIKRSAVAGKIPTTTDLELGELAINTYDGKLYLKKDNGTQSIVDLTDTNDYVSAIDFDTTTGSLTLTRTDSGTVTENLDGRYLTSYTETDTLDSVTARNNSTDNSISVGSVSVASNFDLQSDVEFVDTTTQTSVAEFPSGQYDSAKIVVQVRDNDTSECQISELLVAHDGTTAHATEYGVVHTGSDPLASFDVDIDSGNVRLLATAASANSSFYNVSQTLMTAIREALLSQYPGAAAAYSLRDLNGSDPTVVRVRRSSDNTEQDFTASQITNGTLVSFCGTGDGLVTTWYDQSGNSNDATQATASAQPKIVDTGVLVTESGKPALLHNEDFLDLDITTVETKYTAFVCASQSDSDFSYFYQLNTEGSAQMSLRGGPLPGFPGNMDLRGQGSNDISYSNHSVGHRVISAENQANISQLFYDGGLVASGDIGTTAITKIGVGVRYDSPGFNFVGKYSEFILYLGEALSDRSSIEQNIADYYGITLA